MKKHLVKGSIEAKRYMAKLRAKRTVGAVKKKAVKKAAPKKRVYVKVLGQNVLKGSKMYDKLMYTIKHSNDLMKSEIGSAKKKAVKKAVAKSLHKDTKSHNVNIKVVSGLSKSKKLQKDLKSSGLRLPHGYSVVKRVTGYVGRVIIKKYTVTELKKLNPIYFEKGKDKTHGVYKRKLILSAKLNSQVMIEAQKNTFDNETFRSYVVRKIDADGRLLDAHRFNTLFGAADYIGKNIIL
jgi:hypothetical protein